MANTIQLKRSSTAGAVPSAGSLSAGELAVNTADGKVFLKKDSGTVVELGASGGSGGGASELPVGTMLFGTNSNFSEPSWLKCDGSSYSNSSYPSLASVLGVKPIVSQAFMPANTTWQSLSFNGSIYLTTMTSSTYATSPDGLTWTARTFPVSGNYSGNSWNGSVFCVTSSTTGTNALTSPDGITWTQQTLPFSAAWSLLAWTGSNFVAIPTSGSQGAISPDGITWSLITLPIASSWTAMAYANSQLVLASTQGKILTSPDGTTWTDRSPSHTLSYSSIRPIGTKTLLVGNGVVASLSDDGVIFRRIYLPVSRNLPCLSDYAEGIIICAGSGGFCVSPDGLNWRDFPGYIGVQTYRVAFWNGSSFVIISQGTAGYYTVQLDSSNFVVPAVGNTGGFASGYSGNCYIKT